MCYIAGVKVVGLLSIFCNIGDTDVIKLHVLLVA